MILNEQNPANQMIAGFLLFGKSYLIVLHYQVQGNQSAWIDLEKGLQIGKDYNYSHYKGLSQAHATS